MVPIRWQRSCRALIACSLFYLSAYVAAHAADISLLDLLELDMSYTTLSDQFYGHASAQRLLDGARVGLIAYLRSQNISDSRIPIMHAQPSGRGAVPTIEQQIGRTMLRFGSRVSGRDIVYSVIRGEVAALNDPYSVFFTKSELSGFTTALDGRPFAGIGAVIVGGADGSVRVDQVFAGSPAERAGLQPGDRIISIDGEALSQTAVQTILDHLRGVAGTTVRLAIARPADAASMITIEIVRAAITPPDTTVRMLPGAVGYLKLSTFGPAAGEQVHLALSGLHSRGARAIVFDLRGNGGGYERAAERVASAFVPDGPIVRIAANHGKPHVAAADGTALPALPLVVLVDGDSASGSELVTGAIADHRLGTIVGMQTFGKGLVQSMFPLPDGAALKVTTARYFTPNGSDIDRTGIRPDIVIREPADAQPGVPGHDPQLDAGLAYLNAHD